MSGVEKTFALRREFFLLRKGFFPLLTFGSILVGLYAFLDITQGFNMWDESWFLQIAHRVMSGDVLYRDVFLGIMPLSVYLTAFFTNAFGSEILVLKAIMALIYISTVILSGRILHQVSSGRGFPLFFGTALLALAPPWLNGLGTPYTPLANLLFLGCFSAALFWLENEGRADGTANVRRAVERSMIALAVGGTAAGLSFASKQNVGLYALAALLITVIIESWDKRLSWRRLMISVSIIVLSFCLACVLVLLPVQLSGGWIKLLEYGFFNKATYIQFARVSYFEGLQILIYLIHNQWSVEQLTHSFNYTLFLWPFLTFGALLIVLIRKSSRKKLTVVIIIFVAAAFFGVFPRADLVHLAYVVPELLIGLIYSWNLLKPKRPTWWVKPIQMGMVLWIGIGMSAMLATSVAKITSAKYCVSTLPHFKGVLIEDRLRNEIRTSAEALSEAAARGEQLFLLSPRAGLFYLVSGTKNPTPFDFPLATAFGHNGEADVISSLDRRRLSGVWVDPQILAMPLLRPMRLLSYLENNMKPGERLGTFIPFIFR